VLTLKTGDARAPESYFDVLVSSITRQRLHLVPEVDQRDSIDACKEEPSATMLFQLVGDHWPRRARAARERAAELRRESQALRAQAALRLGRTSRNGSR
jgi:hypothetical protein